MVLAVVSAPVVIGVGVRAALGALLVAAWRRSRTPPGERAEFSTRTLAACGAVVAVTAAATLVITRLLD